jgi:hypothetical protein
MVLSGRRCQDPAPAKTVSAAGERPCWLRFQISRRAEAEPRPPCCRQDCVELAAGSPAEHV